LYQAVKVEIQRWSNCNFRF